MSATLVSEVVEQLPFQLAASRITLRQKSLVDNYIEDKVLWRAAELAGYTGSHQTLCQTARETLNKPEVSAYYQERLAELQLSSSEVLAELGDIGKAPWREFVEVKTGKDGEVLHAQLKLTDKLKALELAGKYHKLWDKPEGELHLSDSDVDRIGTQLLTVMMEAAARKRLGQQDGVVASGADPNTE